ncbi:hypothetical protein AB0P36_21930 [Streptomyces flavidovirens]|uniref:hypothetical protein n=1 Tax=Streptomyces flavidovirens TaxID=67298 RepID=UPI003447FA70
MSDTAPTRPTESAPTPSVTEPTTSAAPGESPTPAPPAEPPLVTPAPRRSPSERVRALRPVTALAVGGVAGAALVALAWAGTAIDFGGPETLTTTGGIFLSDYDGFVSTGELCTGKGGYADLDAGTEVTITDASGTVVAADNLTTGEVVGSACLFNFTVRDIPAGSKLYRVEVSHRGALTKTEAELRKGDIAFTIGD